MNSIIQFVFLFNFISVLVVSQESKKPIMHKNVPILPKTYKDIFAGYHGKPTFGTMKSTCWARGGICVELGSCPSYYYFDAMVPGCDTGVKVCCKIVNLGPPTVGTQRHGDEVLIFTEDLGELNEKSAESIALHNSKILGYL